MSGSKDNEIEEKTDQTLMMIEILKSKDGLPIYEQKLRREIVKKKLFILFFFRYVYPSFLCYIH